MGKHTPGPWDFLYNGHQWLVRCAGNVIAVVGGENHPSSKADAALMAAAPDLLETATRLVQWFDTTTTDAGDVDADGLINSARAAIAKAEGT